MLEIILNSINCDYNNSKFSNCKEYYKIFNKQFSILAKKELLKKSTKKFILGSMHRIYVTYRINRKILIMF